MSPTSSLTSNTSPFTGLTPPATPAVPTGSTQVTKNMFLQLLVAQLKNQDPLQPADGTQFMTQLAQFQQLEQSMNTGQDVTAIRADLDTASAAAAAAAAASTAASVAKP